MPRFAIVEAPSVLGLKQTGVDGLPGALLRLGIDRDLGARRAARLETPRFDTQRDPATDILNGPSIAAWSPRLADAVGDVLDAGEFPVVLGGDCSILLGSMLALKRRGRYGLLFIDGHTDFYQVEVNPNGEVASMDLAFATGRGPALLTDLEGRGPLVRDEDTVAFGFRDAAQQAQYHCQPLPAALLALGLPDIRRMGIGVAARAAIDHLLAQPIDGFFIHLDADCLADDVMPAVDYRLEDGLTPGELAIALQHAMASGRACGIEVTIYNPALDDDGSAGRALAEALVKGLSSGPPL